MSDNLHTLATWAGALLAKLQPAQRRAINHKVAVDLRRSQAQRIKAQQGPDGTAYPARKRRKEFKGKNGRIKRQKAAMFTKIRTAKHLKVKATGDQIEVGFFGWVARVARVHQFGRMERVTKSGPHYEYPKRPLLGLSNLDQTSVLQSLLYHLEQH
ncbi:phage virion morphogenesis family protein [Janthinobacterium sp. HH103]|uniref:phage virion morphogenesis protein n=1 Tax=unclassified Janthinobacterium TaxID=2610881 RepID=UPI0008752CF1|nr:MULTISPECIES: phage virion morphogenesis protein [unclassified Janthinobacterium]OEZ67455.1 phage virion morphogenesis family protein [Janthinobacterium sp. HH103]OEZ67837.1 phage virion morphogenesis family protein [Janthinobacterium sp. HH100]QOU72224.1 Phage virion morphogenesis family protein [Janthinobacterium sp. HH102]